MEIIHLILGKANPERMNGVNKVVHELATRQHAAGIRTSVWGLANDTEHNYPPRNFETKLFAQQKNKFRLPQAIKDVINQEQGDVIFHLHGGWVPQMYSLGKALKQAGKTFVFTPHGAYNTIAMQRSGWHKRLYRWLWEGRLLRNAAAIHVMGKSEIEGLQTWYRNDKTVVIPYGFDIESNEHLTVSSSEDSPAANPSPFIVGFCGRIDIYTKGLDVLADGFARFCKEHIDAVLWIIGDGGERPQLEQRVAAAGIGKYVVFHGAKFGAEKISLLRQCRVFAHPSRNEGLPASVLEAAALGIPCLVTEATNTGDSIRDGNAGYVMNTVSADAMQTGLTSLYDAFQKERQYAMLRDNARNMIRTYYNWDDLLHRFSDFYKAALEKGRK